MTDFIDRYIVKVGDEEFDLNLRRHGDSFEIEYNNEKYKVGADRLGEGKYLIRLNENSSEVNISKNGGSFNIFLEGKEMEVRVEPYNLAELRKRAGSALKKTEDRIVKAPMPGLVLAVNVKPGQTIKKGTTLVIIEAMKMENMIKAAHDGTVKDIFVAAGKAVDKNEKLLELE